MCAKIRLGSLAGLLLLFTAAAHDKDTQVPEIRPGDSREKVLEALGPPRGRIESADTAWFYYDQGEVRMQDDLVTEVSLISPEKARAQRQARQQAREERRRRGEKLRDAMLEDSDFADLPAADQLAFWRQFRSRHPEVDVDMPYQKARIRAHQDAERAYQHRRIAKLERRVQAAEEQARRAEQTAQQARERRTTAHRVRYITPIAHVIPTARRPPHRKPPPPPFGTRRSTRPSTSFRFDRRNDETFQRQHTPRTPPARGYTHGRSHGLGHDAGGFQW